MKPSTPPSRSPRASASQPSSSAARATVGLESKAGVMIASAATRSGCASAKRTAVCAPIEAPASSARSMPALVEHRGEVRGEALVAVGAGVWRRRRAAVAARVVGDHAMAGALQRAEPITT